MTPAPSSIDPHELSSLPPAQQVDAACARLRSVSRWIAETFAGLPSASIGGNLTRLADSLEKGWSDRVVGDKLQEQADAMRTSLGIFGRHTPGGREFPGEFGDAGGFATADGGPAPADMRTPLIDPAELLGRRVSITPIRPGVAEVDNLQRAGRAKHAQSIVDGLRQLLRAPQGMGDTIHGAIDLIEKLGALDIGGGDTARFAVRELEDAVESAASRIEVDSESDSIDDRFAAAAEAARLLRRAL